MRIIFLDIDGPMIPGSMFLIDGHCSFGRRFSPVCCAVIRRLCEDSGAKVVFNTTHNIEPAELREAWGRQVGGALLHEHCHTSYPESSRFHAINNWLINEKLRTGSKPGWVALDDQYIGKEEDGYILVDFDSGLTLTHYNKVMRRWGKKPMLVY